MSIDESGINSFAFYIQNTVRFILVQYVFVRSNSYNLSIFNGKGLCHVHIFIYGINNSVLNYQIGLFFHNT